MPATIVMLHRWPRMYVHPQEDGRSRAEEARSRRPCCASPWIGRMLDDR